MLKQTNKCSLLTHIQGLNRHKEKQSAGIASRAKSKSLIFDRGFDVYD